MRASVMQAIIVSDNGLSPGRRQVNQRWGRSIVICPPAPPQHGADFNDEILNRNSYMFIHENAFQNVVCT